MSGSAAVAGPVPSRPPAAVASTATATSRWDSRVIMCGPPCGGSPRQVRRRTHSASPRGCERVAARLWLSCCGGTGRSWHARPVTPEVDVWWATLAQYRPEHLDLLGEVELQRR